MKERGAKQEAGGGRVPDRRRPGSRGRAHAGGRDGERTPEEGGTRE